MPGLLADLQSKISVAEAGRWTGTWGPNGVGREAARRPWLVVCSGIVLMRMTETHDKKQDL